MSEPGHSLHPLSAKVLSGQAPEPLCLAAARGAVPVPPEELLRLRVHLARHGTEKAAVLCRDALEKQPAAELLPLLASRGCPADVLEYLARSRPQDDDLMIQVVQHASTPDRALESIATHASGRLLEQILINRVRLLRAPELVAALDRNEAVTGAARTSLRDIQAELARRERRQARPAAIRPARPEKAAGPFPEERSSSLPGEKPAMEGPQGSDEAETPAADDGSETAGERRPLPEEGETLFRIQNMNVPQKIELAFKGTREERAILIRDQIKAVSTAVLKSPKLTETEVESFAGMRNLVEEVIRRIAEHREWTKNYAVIHALCKNPKTPVRQALPMLTRLNNRDLKMLGCDRNVGEVIRNTARKYYVARTQSKVRSYRRK
ncbi:MAG: hypothetical protein ACE5HD_05595 [Acidobacteriota bacterium]